MFLFEFDQDSALVSKVVALTNQLEQDLDDGVIGTDYTVDDLLNYFQQYDVILDANDLYNMIKVPPLKGVIRNIKGDKVIFRGQEEPKTDVGSPESDGKDTVKQMAKHAMKI